MTFSIVQSPPESLEMRVTRLAGLLGSEHLSPGDRAALKRWSLGRPLPLTFYRLWYRTLEADSLSDQNLEAWGLVIWGLALMGSRAHQPDRPLGQALAESGFHEARLERLLAADDAIRPALYTAAVRFLAAKGEGFDCREAARFLLTQDPTNRETLHRRLATAFYRHQPHPED